MMPKSLPCRVAERMQVVLASKSPRRVDLLRQLFDERGVAASFAVMPADIDETPLTGETPVTMVERLAREKAAAIAARCACDAVIIAADTTVDIDGHSLGQPHDAAEAVTMLERLSGRSHWVHTGVCVRAGSRWESRVESAEVSMVPFTPAVLEGYVATGESLGKAGAYAIQGHGAALVHRMEGDITAVIGLPLGLVATLLDVVAPGWNLPH